MSKTWIVILTIVITAVVAVGASYYYLNNKAEEEKTELQSQIDELEKKVQDVQSTDTDSDASTSATTDEEVSSSLNEEDVKKEICKQLCPDAEYRSTSNESNTGEVGSSICRVKNIVNNFAYGNTSYLATESGGPGHGWLAVKTGNQWDNVYSAQDMWECNILEKYNFPSELFEGDSANSTCYDYLTQEEKEYSN